MAAPGNDRLTPELPTASFRHEPGTIVVHNEIDRVRKLLFAHHHVRFPTRGMS